PFTRILTVHVFRNASPQILAISGSVIASLFAISAIAEQAFGLSGLGSLLTEAAAREDLPVVQIVSLLLVTIFVVLNAAADLISAAIDPTSVAGRSSSRVWRSWPARSPRRQRWAGRGRTRASGR